MGDRWEEIERNKAAESERKAEQQREAKELAQRLGATVKQLRTAKQVSQEEFAYIVGVHRTYMGLVERGEHNISVHTAHQIAKALGLSLAELFERVEAK